MKQDEKISSEQTGKGLVPTDLRCASFPSPSITDCPNPRLTWALLGEGHQTAYQVVADGWDTGKVHSDRQDIEYSGPAPGAWQDVIWRVRVWDHAGTPSEWVEATWNSALAGQPWPGEWIGSPTPPPSHSEQFYEDRPNPLLRREVIVRPGLRRARIAVCGLGYYELRLNGSKVGDAVLEPAWTPYRERVFYRVYDLTNRIAAGPNAVGIELGNGWWNPLPMTLFSAYNLREVLAIGEPCARAVLRLEYADGTVETVPTDNRWRVGEGAILRNNVYLGEKVDATREPVGWDQPGFDAAAWKEPAIQSGPEGLIQTASLPPIKVRERVPAVSVTEIEVGKTIVDFGQNLAGGIEARFRAPRGTTVTLRFGELLHPDGSLNELTSCACQIKAGVCQGGPGAPETADQRVEYICGGNGEETYVSRFTWHGYRYMEVTGLREPPRKEDFTALWESTAAERVGEFECDVPLLNDIHRISMAALLSNMFSVQSDCPHRERLGYGADIAATTEFAMMSLDLEGFYAKAAGDFADDQDEAGGMPETAPFMGIAIHGFGGTSGPVGWGIAHAVLLRDHFRQYGNEALIREQFDAMRRYTDFLRRHNSDGVVETCISDHESVSPLPRSLTATAHHHEQVAITAWAAELLGRDAKPYRAWADTIRDAFNARFYNPDTATYDTGTQACQVFPLYHGLVPERDQDRVFARLLEEIERCDGHFSTGIYGTKYILGELSKRGRIDVAYRMVTAKGFPGYAYMLEHGATTLWESWTRDERSPSHNHPMFGSVVEWFYHHVAGLAPHQDARGFDRVIVAPKPCGEIRSASARHRTFRGEFSTAWHLNKDEMHLRVSLPPNVRATVMLPDGKTLENVPGGTHDFSSSLSPRNT